MRRTSTTVTQYQRPIHRAGLIPGWSVSSTKRSGVVRKLKRQRSGSLVLKYAKVFPPTE